MKTRYTVEFANGFTHTEIFPAHQSWDMPSAIQAAKDSHKAAFGTDGRIARTEQEEVNE